MPFNLTPNWFRKLRRRKSLDDINAVASDGPFATERRGSSPNRIQGSSSPIRVPNTTSPASNRRAASPTHVRRGRFATLTRRRRSPVRSRRGSSPGTLPRIPPPHADFRPAQIRQVYFHNPPTPEASRVGLFPPPRPEPDAVPIDASTGPIRKEHSFTREEMNQLSKFLEQRGVESPFPAATKDHLNWRKFNQLQGQTLPEALQPSLEAPIAGPSGLHESSADLRVLQLAGIDLSAPEQELHRLKAVPQDLLAAPACDTLNHLIEELQKLQKDEFEEYEDIDDYEMQHPVPDQPQLSTSLQHCTSFVSDLVTHDDEQPKVAKLTKKSLKLTKSLHNLKHDNLVNVREVSAQHDRRMDEEKSPMPRRRLSSGEYFTDKTYFDHLGAKVSPLLYSDPDLVNSQKIVVKTPVADLENLQKVKVKTNAADLMSLQEGEVKTNSTDLVNLQEVEVRTNGWFYDEISQPLEYEGIVQTEKKKDKSAENSASSSQKHDERYQKSKTKSSGGHLLSKQKYVSSEDFRRMNDSVFPIPKSESNLDRVKADAKIYERTREAARMQPTMKQTELQRNYANALDSAREIKPPIPEKNIARLEGTNTSASGRAKEGKSSGFTKNLLSMQPKNTNTYAHAKEKNNPVLAKNVGHAQRNDTNTFGWTQAERNLLHNHDMEEFHQNTDAYRRQLHQGNSLAYSSGIYQPTAQVMEFPTRQGMGPEAPVGQGVYYPTIRKMKSEGYALARNDALAEQQRAVHTPPLQAIHFGQMSEQEATSIRPRRRVMFEGESSAETSSRAGAEPRGATVSNGSSSRADNSESGSVSMSQHLPSAVRFPPQVYGGSRRVLMPDNGRVEFAHLSPTYIHPHPLPAQHQNPFTNFASVRAGEPRQGNFLGYENVGPSVRGYGQAGGRNERACNGVGEVVRDQSSRVANGRVKRSEESKADEADFEYYDNRYDPSHRSTIVMPSTSLDEERGEVDMNSTARRLSMLHRHRQELGLPQRPRPTLTFEIEEPRPATPPNWMANLATTFGRSAATPARERARFSFPFSRRPASLAARPRLLLPAATLYANLARLQREISTRAFFCCVLLPPMWLAFGYGGLDWYMRWESNGQVNEMSAALKERAVPLGWVYGILTIVMLTLLSVYLSTISI
ncbi:hypothetical protein MMC17_003766 [Xylographa soralifera]|nr:hypothetical protein [Xylographa soralifera]